MYYDRFDIVGAYYIFLSEFHEGQGSRKYARLSRMGEYFTPSPGFDVFSLSENGNWIYAALCHKETARIARGTLRQIT